MNISIDDGPRIATPNLTSTTAPQPPQRDAKVTVSDGSAGGKVNPAARDVPLGSPREASDELTQPERQAVSNVMDAVQELGMTGVNIVVRAPHEDQPSPAAFDGRGRDRHIVVPDQNFIETIAQWQVKGGAKALGIELTSQLMPGDVAVHEVAHLQQFENYLTAAGREVSDVDQLAKHVTGSQLAERALSTHAARGRGHEQAAGHYPTAVQTVDEIEDAAIMEGLADSVSATHTQDWRLGEDFFADRSGAVRDTSRSRRQDRYIGAFNDYTPVNRALTDMRAHGAELDAIEERATSVGDDASPAVRNRLMERSVDAAGKYDAAAAVIDHGDPHAAGTIIPRTFREIELAAGWNQAQQLADAVNRDATLWEDPSFATTVDSMRRHAAAIDSSGMLSGAVTDALAKTRLGDASPYAMGPPHYEVGAA